jgi:hypothetical protein
VPELQEADCACDRDEEVVAVLELEECWRHLSPTDKSASVRMLNCCSFHLRVFPMIIVSTGMEVE